MTFRPPSLFKKIFFLFLLFILGVTLVSFMVPFILLKTFHQNRIQVQSQEVVEKMIDEGQKIVREWTLSALDQEVFSLAQHLDHGGTLPKSLGSLGTLIIYDCDSGTIQNHSDKELIGKSIKNFKGLYPKLWLILEKTLGCRANKGSYEWDEGVFFKQGLKIKGRLKYISITPLKNKRSVVAIASHDSALSFPREQLKFQGLKRIKELEASMNHSFNQLMTITIALFILFFVLCAFFIHFFWKKFFYHFDIILSHLEKAFHGQLKKLTFSGHPLFGPLYQSVNLVIERLNIYETSKKSIGLSELVSQVTHDLRSPLAILECYLSDYKGSCQEDQEIIKGSLKRMSDTCNMLLEKRRFLEKKEMLSTCNIAKLVDEVVREKKLLLKNLFCFHKIEFVLDLDEGLMASLNANLFKSSFCNLLNNAFESIPEHKEGIISISLSEDQGMGILTIKDNGKGIKESILEKIGQKGFSSGKENGNGLGVYGAKESFSQWGGTLSFQSKIGLGTMVIIKLPLTNNTTREYGS